MIHLHATVPEDHRLRPIPGAVAAGFKKLLPLLEVRYEAAGRPSLSPDPRLQVRVLSARSGAGRERRFCEPRGYDLLRRWVLDREPGEGRFNPSVVAKNYQRGLWAEGTLSESRASLKSFVRQTSADAVKVQAAKEAAPGNRTSNFRGEQHRHEPHPGPTAPQSGLYRMANGKEATLCFGGHTLMENQMDCAPTSRSPLPLPKAGAGRGAGTRPGPSRAARRGAGENGGRRRGISPEGFCGWLAGGGPGAAPCVPGRREGGGRGGSHHHGRE